MKTNKNSITNISITFLRFLLRENSFIKSMYINRRFNNEISLLKANNQNQKSKNKSTLFFTTHKSGSVFASKTIKIMLEKEDLTFVDLYGYFDMSDFQSLKYLDIMRKDIVEDLSKAFNSSGYVYIPLRHPEISSVIRDIDKFNNIFMLRNPKDVVISSYYSFGYTHEKPINKNKLKLFEKERNSIQSLNLDEYILERAFVWKELFENYIDLINSNQNFLILKFEDMVSDFTSWLTKLESYFEIKLDSKSKAKIMSLHNKYYKQRRQSSNLDVSEQVQKYLDKEFHDILRFFNY